MVRRHGLVFCATLLAAVIATPAHAADDWLDEMPDVAKVAEVVDRAWATSAARQSTVAINTAAALMLLRQLMHYKAAAEPEMSPERRARMQAISDSYLLAEFAIGRSRGVRQGEPAAAALQRNYESRRYEKCATPDCYQYWIRGELEYWGAFKFRQMLFPQLFPCGSAPEMLEIIQRHALEMPLIPFTPAAPLPRDAAEMARLEKLAAVPSACPADGADIDGDGRCFGWEAGLGLARTRDPTTAAACPTFELESATTADAESITVRYETWPGLAGRPIRLTACRAAIPTLASCEGPLAEVIGVETLSAAERLVPGRHEATILAGVVLRPDTSRPYVIIVGDSAGETSQTYFHKWTMGVIVHGYAFRLALSIASLTATTEDIVRQAVHGDEGLEDWQAPMVQTLKSAYCYDAATFAADWRFDSTLEMGSLLTARARELYDEIARRAINMTHQHEGDVVDLHLIGHSRGTVVISEMLKEWKLRPSIALQGSHVRVTLLDAHPANNQIPPPQEDYSDSTAGIFFHDRYRAIQDRINDPLVVLPGGLGIHEAEVWYQHSTIEQIMAGDEVRDDLLYVAPLNLWGVGGRGNHIQRLSDRSIRIEWRDLTNLPLGNEIVDHGGVPLYYQAVLNRHAEPGKCKTPLLGGGFQ